MRRYTRIVFGVSAIFQVVAGLLCLLAPRVVIGLHGGSEADQGSAMLLVAFRLIGVGLIPVGVISALIVGQPDAHPALRALMGLLAVLGLVCWGVAISADELSQAQIAPVMLDVIIRVLVLIAVVFYHPRLKTQQVVVRRRLAA